MSGTKATVLDILERIFPLGTRDDAEEGQKWDQPPHWPPDIFAATAFLLERSGHYAFLTPGTEQHWSEPWFVITAYQNKAWRKAANEWRKKPQVPKVVEQLWRDLIVSGRNESFAKTPIIGDAIPKWVVAAVGLMIISDEACGDVGYLHPDGKINESSWIALLQLKAEIRAILDSADPESEIGPSCKHKTLKRHKYTITRKASTDMVAVQPKAHTAQVGATIRSITQNLALLPPPSRMAATWQRITGRQVTEPDLNILLVPIPYDFHEDWIIPLPSGDKAKQWGWFDIEQRWLPKNPEILASFVSALIEEAERKIKKVHVLMFPEFSLTWEHYEKMVEYLAAEHEHLEFVVAGSSTNCETAEGNFALTSSISRSNGKPIIHTNSRGKHHRWRLDARQIRSYGFEGKLDTKVANWWEGIAIPRRQVHTHVFRNSSCFTTFICEDLARSDPSHETVRSLGPSIVFCLLMDGVQIPARWSARYAEGLVEDPGSAVLTFTCRGLIDRSREKEIIERDKRDTHQRALGREYPRSENWSVALWRDSKNGPIELHCPPGDHGVLLCLKSDPMSESTYDGRANNDGVSWHYDDCHSVRLSESDRRLQEFIKSEKLEGGEVA